MPVKRNIASVFLQFANVGGLSHFIGKVVLLDNIKKTNNSMAPCAFTFKSAMGTNVPPMDTP